MVVRDKERNEESRAIRLAITKVNHAISGKSVKKCELRYWKTKPGQSSKRRGRNRGCLLFGLVVSCVVNKNGVIGETRRRS